MAAKKDEKVESYDIHTSQEVDALLRALADGKTGRHWRDMAEAAARVHQTPGASHHVSLTLTYNEYDQQRIAAVTERNDSDMDFALLFISKRLTPQGPIAPDTAPRAVIVLDDVIKAIGWNPLYAEQRIAMRRRIWQFLRFAASIRIVGERSYKQRGKDGAVVETFIDSPPWLLGGTERETNPNTPTQYSLFFEDENTPPPLSVEIVATQMWQRLTMMPDTAQFIAGAEILGSIPSGKATGAWARSIGLALANLWRRNPREALAGKIRPTRRELLERYAISVSPPQEVLDTKNSVRALQHWVNALEVLVDAGFLEKRGDAALTYEEMRAPLPLRDWSASWLDTEIELWPGAKMQNLVEERAAALPQPKS